MRELMLAFLEMFYEPNADPRRLSMSRLIAWPCAFIGLIAATRGALLAFDLTMVYTGMGLIAAAVVLHTLVEWRRVKIGTAEIERGGSEGDSNMQSTGVKHDVVA